MPAVKQKMMIAPESWAYSSQGLRNEEPSRREGVWVAIDVSNEYPPEGRACGCQDEKHS